MKINDFWVVTHATPDSTLGDILFKADWKRMRLQYAGGLGDTKKWVGNKIVGVWSTKTEAEKVAKNLIRKARR